MCPMILRIDLDGRLERVARFGELTEFQVDAAQIVVRRCIVGLELEASR